jgi:hypothetical protein
LAVEADGARVESPGESVRAGEVRRPGRGSEAVHRVVGHGDDLLVVVERVTATTGPKISS